MSDREKLMLQLFQSMDDECQEFTLRVAKGWAEASPRHKRPVLKLIQGGPRAVSMKKKGARHDVAPQP
jgi:hypothetical protein